MAMPGHRDGHMTARVRACWALALALLGGASAACAQSPDSGPTFEIRGYTVEGNSLLSRERIDAVLAPYTGGERSFADVQAAVVALQQTYASAGYGAVKVAVPEQRLSEGSIRLQVVEARLRSLAISGNEHFDTDNIRRSLPALRGDAPPNTDELAQEIRLANENPAKRISVELKSDTPGAIDAAVVVRDDKPWKVGAVLDNTGTPATGRLRSGVFFQHANVADLDHVFTGQYVTSPENLARVTIVAANYRIPLYRVGDSVDLFGIHADVDSGVVGDLFNLRGRGSVAGVRYNQNLQPTAGYRHRLSYGFEYRLLDNQVTTLTGGTELLPDVVVHPLSIGYSAGWSGERQQLDFSTTYVRNIPGGHLGREADIQAARAGANASYQILRWSATFAHTLPEDWRVRVVGDGQYTRDSLVSGEQFGIGGQDSVRGFLEREIINDSGHRLTLELVTPDFGSRMQGGLAANALLFYDHGRVTRNRALAGETGEVSISSFGAGLRLTIAPRAPLRHHAAPVIRGTASRPRGTETLHFSLGIAC
jgi:hemolysin activation/secretion protein